jgi:hypothetical protein
MSRTWAAYGMVSGRSASRQHARTVAKHDQPARVLFDTTAINRPSDGQTVITVEDLLKACAFAAYFEELDVVFAFGRHFGSRSPLAEPAPGFPLVLEL